MQSKSENLKITGVFRKTAQSSTRPWALILGGRLYDAMVIWLYGAKQSLISCVAFGHNCHITAQAVIQFTSYFSDLSFFQLTAQDGFSRKTPECQYIQINAVSLRLALGFVVGLYYSTPIWA